jgi:tetratricopeptide (TPR) repeat protein
MANGHAPAFLRGIGWWCGVGVCLSLCAAPAGCGGSGGAEPSDAVATPPQAASATELASVRDAAEKALDDGRIDDAERLARYLAERDRSGSGEELLGRIWLVRATQALQRGDRTGEDAARQAAADAYRRAALADPTNAALQDAAGLVLDSAGHLPEAIAHYTRALVIDPAFASALLHRSNAHLRAGDRERAAQDARTLEGLAPEEPWAHALLAEIALGEGDFPTSLARATRARALAPTDLAFRVLHARALRLSGDAQAAVEQLIGLDATERASRAVASELATGWNALGRPADARDVWANAYRLGPPPARLDAALEAGNAAIDAGDLVDAERWLSTLESLAADDDHPGSRAAEFRARLTAARAAREASSR